MNIKENNMTGQILDPSLTRAVLLDGFEAWGGRIVSPGKFEGEPVFAIVLYELAMCGCADSDDGTTATFRINKDDPLRREYPEFNEYRKRVWKLEEDSQGFVHVY